MAGSFVSRAARALRDPWSLVVAGVGAGSAWAIGLPVGRRRAGRRRHARRRRRGRRRGPRRRRRQRRAGRRRRCGRAPSRPSWSAPCRATAPTSNSCSSTALAPAVGGVRGAGGGGGAERRNVWPTGSPGPSTRSTTPSPGPRVSPGRCRVPARCGHRSSGCCSAGTTCWPSSPTPSTRSARSTPSCWSSPPPRTWSAWTTDGVTEAAQVNDSLDAIRGVVRRTGGRRLDHPRPALTTAADGPCHRPVSRRSGRAGTGALTR